MAKTNLSQSDLDKTQESDGSPATASAASSVDIVADDSDDLIEEVSEMDDLSDIAVELSSGPTLYSTPPDHPRAGKVIFFPPKPRKPAGAEEGMEAVGGKDPANWEPSSWSSLASVLPAPTPLRKPVFGGAAANPPELAPPPVEPGGSTAAPRSGSTVAPHPPGPAARPRPVRSANAVRSAALRPAGSAEEPTGEIEVPKRRSGGAMKTLAAVICLAVVLGGGTWLIRTRGSDVLRAALLKLGKGPVPAGQQAVKGSTQGAEQAIAADPDLAPPDFEAAFPAQRPVPATPLPPRSPAPAVDPPRPTAPAAADVAKAPSPTPAPAQVATATPVPSVPKPSGNEDFTKLLGQAQDSVKAGKHGGAVPVFRKALALNPASVDAKVGLGAALVHSSRTNEGYLEAVKLLREAVAAEPDRAQAWFVLGTGNQFIGRGKDAAEAYRRFLEIEPEGTLADEVRSILKDMGG